MKKITTIIITLNEEKNIVDCINSVKDISDEVLVIDSNSSDKTREIAESMGAKVVIQNYLGDGPQKAFGEPIAKNSWILSLDADERLDRNAIDAIKALDLENSKCDGYIFRRKTFIGDNFIELWYPDKLIRLYNKESATYSKEMGHAGVIATKTEELDGDILHYSYDDYSHMINTISKFATRGAKILFEKKKFASWYDPMVHGTFMLFKSLVLKGGMFHGRHGWNVAIVSAFSSYMKYAILLEMQKEKR